MTADHGGYPRAPMPLNVDTLSLECSLDSVNL
jgi:hypothetical protein